ncbi:hypothetical protein ME803_18580 [Lactobacillus delbrueckii]|nr:hypothetical protein ME803_18580 [Lactobacillus delbrueckii]
MTAKQDMITQDLAGKIRHGIYPPKSFLPSENELANLYGASRNTVRKSLEDLTSLGLIQKIKGKGSIVLDFSRLSFPISRITTFNELNQSLGLKAETKLLEIKEVKKVPDDFSCDNTEPFIKVKRLRIIDGEPDVLDVDYISTKYVKEISPSVAEHSLYDYFENANCKNKLNTYHNIWQILTIYAGKCGQVRCQSTLLESCSLRSSEEESCTIPRS